MREYHGSTLVQVPSKGNRWYVYVTKPEALRGQGGKQAKKSTGTTDYAIAKTRQHKITEDIYRQFDQQLAETVTFESEVEKLLRTKDITPDMLQKQWREPEPLDQYQLMYWLLQLKLPVTDDLVAKMHPEYRRRVLDSLKAWGDWDWEPFHHVTPLFEEKKFSDLLPQYLEGRRWDRLATRNEAKRYINSFIELVGDLDVAEVKFKTAYDFAQALHDQGKANKTITSAISYVRAMLTWCVTQGTLDKNPWSETISLRGYGYKKTSYRPFRPEQLEALFALPMPQQDRLCLSILVTTGMRLDEVALLTWENVKMNAKVPHFDLTDAIVKNEGSERFVPIPDVIMPMLKPSSGRLFTYPLDRDGKAQRKASERLGKHIHKIRDHPKQTTHSLRGTLKDLLRDAGVSREVNNFITGHDQGDRGGEYGVGPSLEVRRDALDSVEHPWLDC